MQIINIIETITHILRKRSLSSMKKIQYMQESKRKDATSTNSTTRYIKLVRLR